MTSLRINKIDEAHGCMRAFKNEVLIALMEKKKVIHFTFQRDTEHEKIYQRLCLKICEGNINTKRLQAIKKSGSPGHYGC